MTPLSTHPDARPLGLLALSLASLMLLGFHQVVNGAVQRAELQRAQVHLLAEQEASCASLVDMAQRELCALRAEQAVTASTSAATDGDTQLR